jgi:predicted helicase
MRYAVLLLVAATSAGVPSEAWQYRLGSRSAIDWVLEQHKERKVRDKSLPTRFHNYRFASHKEEMIALLAKVVTVSLETSKITRDMHTLDRGEA